MIIPKKLGRGDEIRIISPSRSLSLISEENIILAKLKLERLGYKVTFSKHSKEIDMFNSSSIQSRIDDIHTAFSDKNVKALFTSIGGFNSNQLLDYLDYSLIKKNPKILCGYSDITALANAITSKTGIITYSGPHFSTWAMKKEFEYTLEYFNKCLVNQSEYLISPSKTWSDDPWYEDQDNRKLIPNDGYIILNEGKAEGKIIGGNLCTFNMLQGTEYMPDLSGSILFLEEDNLAGNYFCEVFERDIQSIMTQPGFDKVKCIVFGRAQKKTNFTIEKLREIIKSKDGLKDLPVIYNVDFGHTSPMITFPIGGTAIINAEKNNMFIKILKH